VVIHFNELRNKIQLNHFNTNSTEVNQSTDDNQPNSGIYEFDNRYIISDICFDYLSRMEATANEKDEFTTSYQTVFTGQPQALANLQVFQESYSPDRALLCLRKNPLFIRILENIFQSANTQKMYICRFLIRDIQKQFEQHKCTSSISVYRGQRVSDENLQELKNSKGKIIAMKSFFSTTLNRDVAMVFIADQNEQKRVLFEVEANPQIEGAKAFMKMGPVFDQIDDDEVLFMLGSLFKINEIRDDENGITIIKMALCANENDNSIKSQLNITNEGNGLIEYAQLQYNLSEILKYPGVLHHVVELLEKYLNESSDDHPDRIRCYDLLGSVTFAMDDLDACLNWSLKAFEIKKKSLRPDDPQLAACYEYLAYVYLHKGENTQALDLFKQILTIYKQILGDDHLSLIQYYLRMIEIHEYEGKFTDVLLCYNQIFSIMLKHYPIDDLNLAPIYSNIGKTWASLFQYPLALGYYQTSLGIKLKHLPSSSDSTALTYKNIGFVYKDMKNIDQARIHFEKAAAIYRELHSSTYEVVLEIEQILQNLSSSPQ
jgi:tetratricopeptide (TPR) repeat protein